MTIICQTPQIFSGLQIEVAFGDLEKKIQTSGDSPTILEIARKTLTKMQDRWQPAAILQWFKIQLDTTKGIGYVLKDSGESLALHFGRSVKHLKHAEYVMVASYTVGQILDKEASDAGARGKALEAYLIDLIALTALDKAGDFVRGIAEEQARNMGWGVGPFLSPGSVHGWELEQQSQLCTLLSLEAISVQVLGGGVLFPLKSISAMIGIGPGYTSVEVGSTCDACSKRHNCLMRRE